MFWRQTQNSVTIRFVCHTFRDIEADNVSCDITEDSISLKVAARRNTLFVNILSSCYCMTGNRDCCGGGGGARRPV